MRIPHAAEPPDQSEHVVEGRERAQGGHPGGGVSPAQPPRHGQLRRPYLCVDAGDAILVPDAPEGTDAENVRWKKWLRERGMN